MRAMRTPRAARTLARIPDNAQEEMIEKEVPIITEIECGREDAEKLNTRRIEFEQISVI